MKAPISFFRMKTKQLVKTVFLLLLFSVSTSWSQQPIFASYMSISTYNYVFSPWSSEDYRKVIDGNIDTKCIDLASDDGFGFTVNLGGESAIANKISVTTASDVPGRDPVNYQVFGSIDGTNFTSLTTGVIPCVSNRNFTRTFSFVNTAEYFYYRINFTNTCSSQNFLQIAEVQLYENETRPVMRSSYVGTVLPTISTIIPFTYYSYAEQYMYEVTNLRSNGLWPVTYISNKYCLNLTKITSGIDILYGQTYVIRAKIKVNGIWRKYGKRNIISTPAIVSPSDVPLTSLSASQCGTTLEATGSPIYAQEIFGAQGYRFQFNNGTDVIELQSDNFLLADPNNIPFGTTYSVKVAAKINEI